MSDAENTEASACDDLAKRIENCFQMVLDTSGRCDEARNGILAGHKDELLVALDQMSAATLALSVAANRVSGVKELVEQDRDPQSAATSRGSDFAEAQRRSLAEMNRGLEADGGGTMRDTTEGQEDFRFEPIFPR